MDGPPDWFWQGQSTIESGLARTAFGIPAGCASEYTACNVFGLIHYTWAIQLRGGLGTIGATIPGGPNLAYWPVTLPGFIHFFLYCHTDVNPPPYAGPLLDVRTFFDTTLYYLIEWRDGGTTMSFGPFKDSLPEDWAIRMHYLPGP